MLAWRVIIAPVATLKAAVEGTRRRTRLLSVRRLALISAAVYCALAPLTLPAEASAAKRAKFRVTASGTDTGSWSYRFAGSCGGRADFVGSGSETVRYKTTKPVVVYARAPIGGDTRLDPTADNPILGPGPNDGARFPVDATITRQNSVTPCPDGEPVTASDCGTKRFSILGNLRFLRSGRLGFFSMAASRRYPFRNCHNYFGRARGSVGIGTRERGARLSKKTLFDSRKRRFTISVRSTYRVPGRPATFVTTWKATFRRIR